MVPGSSFLFQKSLIMNSNNPLLRCVVVEDEAESRQWLCDRLNEMRGVEVVGSADKFNQAFLTIVQQQPNALFLDIKLIGGDAFQLLQRLREHEIPIPPVVMVTAFEEYAMQTLNDWGNHVKKYLKKPFLENWEEKLQDCIDTLIVANNLEAEAAAMPEGDDFTFVKDGAQLIRVNYRDLLWIEVAGGGAVFLVTDELQVKRDITLAKILKELPGYFQQISRDKAVNLQRVLRVDRRDRGAMLPYQGKEKFLGIGDTYYQDLLNRLKIY